jgi:MOSC domain-containing protein YiiM
MNGKLTGIARAVELRAPLEEIVRANISTEAGVEGDARGRKLDRQVTVLFRESWEDACRDLGCELPWVTRRANLLIEGIPAPQQAGGKIRIGNVTLEIMFETQPCQLMEKARSGLKAALTPAWRGGVCCNVRSGGTVEIGDAVAIT